MKKNRKARRLIDKSTRSVKSAVFSRLGLIVLLLLLQFMLLFSVFTWFASFIPHFFGSTIVFNFLMAMVVINGKADASSKLTWMVVMTALPVFGALLYLYTRSDLGHRTLKRRISILTQETRFDIRQEQAVADRLVQENPGAAALARYVGGCACQPIWQNTNATYFPSGEDYLENLLEDLDKAESFIFMEYFVVAEGVMWGQILTILEEKAKNGVDVRLLIDGTCEFMTLPHDYPKRLQQLGIRCRLFAPAKPFISTHYNYRDHRKITVIDGRVSYTGGVNLADEYINELERFGHWKDVGLRLEGDATRSFTLMFLQMWGLDGLPMETDRYTRPALPWQHKASGYVMPYSDCPLDQNKVGERVYMDILYRAKKYVHIMTPYLILDGAMEAALKYAAERGVDVHLILPGVPDKKYAWWLARTYYGALLASGVKISEYAPGFVHAKVFVADDMEAVVGTINLDYRSLYHHFECAAFLYNTACIADIEADFQATLAKCTRMTEKRLTEIPWYQSLAGAALKALAPLM